MKIKTPVTIKIDGFTGYAYILEGKDTILARSNSELVANAIAASINTNAELLDALEDVRRNLAKARNVGADRTALILDAEEIARAAIVKARGQS